MLQFALELSKQIWPNRLKKSQQWRRNYFQLQHGCCCPGVYGRSLVPDAKRKEKNKFLLYVYLFAKGQYSFETFVFALDCKSLNYAEKTEATWRDSHLWLRDLRLLPTAPEPLSRVFSCSLKKNAFFHPWDGGSVRRKRIYVCGECFSGR